MAPVFGYFRNLVISQIIIAITTATSSKPVHIPALKILPIASQEVMENNKTEKRAKVTKLIRCIFNGFEVLYANI